MPPCSKGGPNVSVHSGAFASLGSRWGTAAPKKQLTAMCLETAHSHPPHHILPYVNSQASNQNYLLFFLFSLQIPFSSYVFTVSSEIFPAFLSFVYIYQTWDILICIISYCRIF